MKSKIFTLIPLAILGLAFVASNEAFWLSDYVKRTANTIFAKSSNLKHRLTGSNSSSRVYPVKAAPLNPTDDGGSASDEPTVRRTLDTPDGQYNPKCFITRGPSLQSDPEVHFYSSETHSRETVACQSNLKIPLKTLNIDKDKDPELSLDDDLVQNQLIGSGRYVGSRPTYIMIHGFLANWNGDNWMCNLKDLILNSTEANVFILDWSGGAKPMLPIDYGAAVGNTKYVGQLLSAFVNELIRLTGQTDASNFHIIGHSLGAHIGGFVGYSVQNLGRVTGLDPAGPCFSTFSDEARASASKDGNLPDKRRRLSPLSAQFVLAMHTDTALFGLNENCGHYDVYVNGGHKQPDCGSISLTSRVKDLLDLDFDDALDANIACAHSYAHELVDTFAALFTSMGRSNIWRKLSDEISPEQTRGLIGVADNQCYPIAYQCDDWSMFKSGECGWCYNNDARCVFTGLTLGELAPRLNNPQIPAPSMKDDMDDDIIFNDEDEEPHSVEGNSKGLGDSFVPSEQNSRGQHFIKTASNGKTCMYHYQIIVAARKSQLVSVKHAARYYYYLHIPLEQSGLFKGPNGEQLNDRLIQVSHKIDPNSSRYSFIIKRYLAVVNNRKSLSGVQLQAQDIELYTTLVTFRQAPEEQCLNGESDGNTRTNEWQLCRPLDRLQEAQLWSSSDLKLNAVQWISINYLSGLDLSQRVKNSYVFNRDTTQAVKTRAEIEKSDRADMGDMSPKQSRSVGNVIKDARKPIDCFISLLNRSDANEAATNFKCGRSSRELKYAIKLKPIKL